MLGTIAAVVVIGTTVISTHPPGTGSPPPPPGSANFFVDTNGGTCTRNSTPAAYVDTTACASFNAAYQAASKGDLVLVQAGTYGNQTFVRKASISTGPYSIEPDGSEVTFRPASGVGTVTLGDLSASGGGASGCDPQTTCRDSRTSTWTMTEHVLVEDMSLDSTGTFSFNYVRDFHLDNIEINAQAYLDHSQYFSLTNSDVGGWSNAATNGSDGMEWGEGMDWILVENTTVHDITTDAGCAPVCHPDGFSINDIYGNCGEQGSFVLSGNRFWNNDIINQRGGCDNMIVQNSFYGLSNHAYSAQFHGDNSTIRFNTIQGDYQATGSGESQGQVWLGNIGPQIGFACPYSPSAGSASYNVWVDRPVTCNAGANNSQVANMNGWFVNAGEPFDGHITSSATAAIGKVPAASCPTTDWDGTPFTDIDGQVRPLDTNCDAGADERDD